MELQTKFEDFMNDNKDSLSTLNEAASDWTSTVKDKNSNRIEITIKGLQKVISKEMGKEAVTDQGFDHEFGMQIYKALSDLFTKKKFKPKELNDLSPKKITIQF